jgi:hypothetical protein
LIDMKITVRPYTPAEGGEVLISLHFPYNKELISELKATRIIYEGHYPKRQRPLAWDPGRKFWVLRPEAFGFFQEHFAECGIDLLPEDEAERERLNQVIAACPYEPPAFGPEFEAATWRLFKRVVSGEL